MENGDVQENRYDTEGLRYELLENGKCTWFVYQNGELLYECGEGEETSYHLGAGAKAFRRSRKVYYYHQDEQLNIALITDRRADIRNQYQYDAFGAELESMEQFTNRLRYTGQQYDQLTGQYYLRARYYNPVLGRFMQEDVYQGDGLNLYAYCKNNPVIYYDPSGFYDKDFFADRITYGDEGKSTDLKLDMLKIITGDNTIKRTDIDGLGSHQAQHLIPGSLTVHPVTALAGYLTNRYGNGILDRNFSKTGGDANSLANFLAGRNVSQVDMQNYISDTTHHGVYFDPIENKHTVFNHEAYNIYVEYKLDKIAKDMGIPIEWKVLSQKEALKMLENYKASMSEADMTLFRDKVEDLAGFLRTSNQDGIDLYLKHPKNQHIQDYYTHNNNGNVRTKKRPWNIGLNRILMMMIINMKKIRVKTAEVQEEENDGF